jgi:hypothetical protein
MAGSSGNFADQLVDHRGIGPITVDPEVQKQGSAAA